MGQILESIEKEFPAFVDIVKRINELDQSHKNTIFDKEKEIRILQNKIESLESDLEDKEGEIESLESDIHDTSDIPKRLLQNDLDTIGKNELYAEYIDKYNYFQLKERLEK